MKSRNYINIKKNTPLEIQVKVLEDIIAKQQAYIDKIEKQLKLYGVVQSKPEKVLHGKNCDKLDTCCEDCYNDYLAHKKNF